MKSLIASRAYVVWGMAFFRALPRVTATDRACGARVTHHLYPMHLLYVMRARRAVAIARAIMREGKR